MEQQRIDEIEMSDFLEWANDKITVIWCYGSMCYSEQLEKFAPKPNEKVYSFLSRIVDWVNDKDDSEDDEINEYVFMFINNELSEEYEEYQEETMTVEDVLECYNKMRDVN